MCRMAKKTKEDKAVPRITNGNCGGRSIAELRQVKCRYKKAESKLT